MQCNLRACNSENGSKPFRRYSLKTSVFLLVHILILLLNIGLIASFATVDGFRLSSSHISTFPDARSSSSSLLLYYNLCLLRYWTCIYRWLSMARTPMIPRNSWSLEVKLQFRFISRYNWANILPISRSSQPLELSPGSHYTHFIVFLSQSLEVLIAHTRSPIKRTTNTHWDYRYLDNGDRRGAGVDVKIRWDT